MARVAVRGLGALLLLVLPLGADAGVVTLSYKTLLGDYKVTFDSAKLPEEDMKRLVLLSPHLHGWESYAIAPRLERCLVDDLVYLDCGSLGASTASFTRNARLNLEKGATLLKQLGRLRYPRELSPVVEYSQRSLAFSLWLEETKLDFYRTWDAGVLTRTYEDLDSASLCRPAVDEILKARDAEDRYRLTTYAWHNCVNDAYRARLGDYPVQAWQMFIRAHGIQEHVLETFEVK